MRLIDTHAHLFDERFASDLPAVLDRAVAAGIEMILAVGIDLETSQVSVAQARSHGVVRAAVGIQPNHVSEAQESDWPAIVQLAESSPEVVAIGETGLDRYWDRAPFPLQEEYFQRHLDLGHRLQKAVIIHCREAEADVVRMLGNQHQRHGPIRAVMHSFTGDLATAQRCLEMGLYISFAGMITYKSAADLRHVASHVPRDRLLVETDCPYLAPVPRRGQRNEPANVAHTLQCLAEVLGVSADELSLQTTENARRLFQIE